MTDLRQALHDYLTIRRRLGFELEQTEAVLEKYVNFMERAGASQISTELAVMFAKLPINAHPRWWQQRLGIVRTFARYVATIDPDGEVPPEDLLPARQHRLAPYLYTQQEITALLAAARALSPRLRAASIETVIGLLATTGLRTGEALALDRADVNLRDGALHVRAAKQKKQREVPLHQTTIRKLREYARVRDSYWLRSATPAFFLDTGGQRLGKATFNHQFAKLIGQIGLEGAGERARPRPHDLRHTLAIRTLVDWIAAGENVERRMPELSTFLGHAQPESTYWYLQAVPELMALIAARLQRLPEVLR
jgi:integrase/recombinase XerD